ncbi:hypothetical protein EYF80_029796 [Liparis tanakae]|uniref:Uncharacterized protein n=1 Tax=Liparis tanakae TaxID=230148 RepID=A0A4Z2H552_9TELE|nr:hypothetical protein EYF80_029796 [Liparis tanakae]
MHCMQRRPRTTTRAPTNSCSSFGVVSKAMWWPDTRVFPFSTTVFTVTSSSGKLGRLFVVSLEQWAKADDIITGGPADNVSVPIENAEGDLLLLVGGGGNGAVGIQYSLGTAHHRHQQEEKQQEEEEDSEAQVHVDLELWSGTRSLVHVGDEDSPFTVFHVSSAPPLSEKDRRGHGCSGGDGDEATPDARNTKQKNTEKLQLLNAEK